MGFLATIKNALSTVFPLVVGKSVQVNLQGEGDTEDDSELYHVPGLYSVPVDGLKGVVIDINDDINIVVATHDYNLSNNAAINSLDKGECIIYSINSLGVIQGSIYVNKAGEIVINEGLKSAVSHAELNTALQTLVTAINAAFATKLDGGGSSPGLTIDISASEVSEVKLP